MQKYSSSLYSNFISNLFIIYELNNGPCNPSNNFVPKIVYLVKKKKKKKKKLTTNAEKSKFVYNGGGVAFNGAV